MHPGTFRLEKCLDALQTRNRRKIRINVHLVRQLADYLAGHWPAPGRQYGQKRITIKPNYLPREVSYVAAEFRPFKIAQDDTERRPWYVMHVDRRWLGKEKAVPESSKAKQDIAQVFAALIEKHDLRIHQMADDHWNLTNKSSNKTFAVSIMKGKLMLVADHPERLLEMANHYFHYAHPIEAKAANKVRNARTASDAIQITEYIGRRAKSRDKVKKTATGQLEFGWDEKAA